MATLDLQPDGNIRRTRIGVWDIYEYPQPEFLYQTISSIRWRYTQITEIAQTIPYIARMFKDIFSIRRARMLLPAFLAVEILESLLPSISLWYSGKLLHLTQTVLETRSVDTTVLIHVAAGRVACTVAGYLLRYARLRITIPLRICVRQFYDKRMFHYVARLDLPTFEGSTSHAQRCILSLNGYPNIPWDAVVTLTRLATMGISLLSELSVLFTILREQQDGLLLAILGFSRPMFRWYYGARLGLGVFASSLLHTTTNKDYIRMEGLKHLVTESRYRKELVASNIDEYITSQFRESAQRIGDDAGDFEELGEAHSIRKHLSIVSILQNAMQELPQIAFTLRAAQKPMTIPLSLASLALVEHASTSYMSTYFPENPENWAFTGIFTIHFAFTEVRRLYDVENMRNKVVDGTEPFSLKSGISVEFRNISFQYPLRERYALQDVSFKIEAGQLCVIVGANGSGKSTILNLIFRIYDPTEGSILIDNRDIKTLRLADLRAAMSVLFQDYTHFPLTISENIGLGNPVLAHDSDKIREAARLGSAEEFIDDLPDGFDTYVDCPAANYYAKDPEMPFEMSHRVLRTERISATLGFGASGGEMQRLAVSRTFMRSLPTETESSAGMLLFDEPSASLDPTAEYDLFERLRKLKGDKTMIFSTHRYGNLTRHADIILYMDESVKEQGTHDELMKQGGEYARNWNLQAKPFL